ncbi:MAG: hypothetical protein JO134_18325, partial [Xanthobacteraceae bacterium]|nr:hypothetical protein [Xanthobacteraceae bacterium]
MLTRRTLLRSIAALTASMAALTTRASTDTDNYPVGPIKSICPFAPGSGA